MNSPMIERFGWLKWRHWTLVLACWASLSGRFGAIAADIPEAPPATKAEAAVASTEQSSVEDLAAEARLRASVQKLAADEWEGRGPGTKGLDLAAEYIAEEFRNLGLKTDLVNGTPFQEFSITAKVERGPADKNQLKIVFSPAMADSPAEANTKSVEPRVWELDVDFRPLSLGGSAEWNFPLVFAGYGISSKEDNYDDYEGLDVTGKAVILLRHEPRQSDPHSPFAGTADSPQAALSRKVSNAYQHGAAAVVFVTDEVEIRTRTAENRKHWEATFEKLQTAMREFAALSPDDPALADKSKEIQRLTTAFQAAGEQFVANRDPLIPFERGDVSDARKMPVIHATREVVNLLLARTGQKSLAELEAAIDQDLRPRSFPLSGATILGETNVQRVDATLRNVIGVLEGTGPHAEETLIIGAHYDHLGRGDAGTLDPGSRDVHNGADDNASGTAALLEVARRFAGKKLSRRVVFIAFSGEERGLLGSAHYVQHPLFPLENTIAMLNMDMVGRLQNEQLIIYGFDTAKEFDELLERVNQAYKLNIKREPGGFGPSDHASFYAKKIPVLHFFTGLHADYHRPGDDVEKINFPGMRRVLQFLGDTAVGIVDAKERPFFTLATKESFHGHGDPNAAPAPKGARPYFGSIPDLSYNGEGYALQGVAEQGPAAKGGIMGGDVIIAVGENKIGNLADFDSALRKYKSGESVEITVKRGEEEKKFQVTLEPPRS
ncbi:MAG: M28 family peptidase [Pirellulales bacterium]|nr:M28 family peptidase [Pirellulales bacterium]